MIAEIEIFPPSSTLAALGRRRPNPFEVTAGVELTYAPDHQEVTADQLQNYLQHNSYTITVTRVGVREHELGYDHYRLVTMVYFRIQSLARSAEYFMPMESVCFDGTSLFLVKEPTEQPS